MNKKLFKLQVSNTEYFLKFSMELYLKFEV